MDEPNDIDWEYEMWEMNRQDAMAEEAIAQHEAEVAARKAAGIPEPAIDPDAPF
jgi:hypothetical protein